MKIMKKLALSLALLFLLTGTALATDQTIAATEEMVGSGHATKTDTLNRLTLVEHNADGTHKKDVIFPAWSTPAFDAGDFTAYNTMTWTVAAGDVTTYAYIITGKMMTVNFYILTSTVGGTPTAILYIAIPASKVATKKMNNLIRIWDNASKVVGSAEVEASGTKILIERLDGGAFSASTDNTRVIGQITFEIN